MRMLVEQGIVLRTPFALQCVMVAASAALSYGSNLAKLVNKTKGKRTRQQKWFADV